MKLLRKLCCLCLVFALCTAFLPNTVFALKGVNIAFVGLYGSGKSALRAVAAYDEFDFTGRVPTNKTEVHKGCFIYRDGPLLCNLYDTSGQDRDRSAIIENDLKDADIVVLTIDASDEARVEGMGFNDVFIKNYTEWAVKIRRANRRLPILLVATKIDVSTDPTPLNERLQSLTKAFSETYDFDNVAVSAINKTNLGDALDGRDYGNNFWGKIRCIMRDREIRPHDMTIKPESRCSFCSVQ